MKKFQYQLLQFFPDKVTGEFLNVGIVVFDPEEQQLGFKILHKVGTIGQLFDQINTRYLVKQLHTIDTSLGKIRRFLADGTLRFDQYKSVDEVTRKAFVRDDSALLFSQVYESLDISIDHLTHYLGQRMLTAGVMEIDEQEVTSDKDVWTKMFKSFFEKAALSDRLMPRTIKTKYDEITFEQTWKNGHLHFFEAVNFDLQREDTIKNKVRRWAGQIDELATVGEDLHLYLLANMPTENSQMRTYVTSFLADKSSADVKVEVVTTDEAEQLVMDLNAKMAGSGAGM